MTTRKFQRTKENFVCETCGTHVTGNGYTDHCPKDLTSKHVDINPGDRANTCQGKMVPIGAEYKGGEFTIFYRCQKCHDETKVKSAPDDNKDLLIELASGKGRH
jgi:hypothetical protein